MLEFLKNILSNYKNFEEGAFMKSAVAERKFVNDTFSKRYPAYLNLQRPSASPQTKTYRKDFFNGTGNPAIGFYKRFLNTYTAIFDSEEFEVNFGADKDDKYHLEKYLRDEYINGDYIKSFKESILSRLIKEPNGIFYVFTMDKAEDSLPKPIIGFEPAENVFIYSENLCFFRSSKKVQLGNEPQPTGNIFYVFTNFHYVVLTQVRGVGGSGLITQIDDYDILCKDFDKVNGKLTMLEPLEHNCPTMPVFLIGGDIEERNNDKGSFYRNSIIKQAIPFLRSAQFDWLDCATNKAYNSGGFMWAYGNNTCPTCKGKKSVRIGASMTEESCDSCKGSGQSFNIHSGDMGDVVLFPLEQVGTLAGEENNIKKPTPSQMFGRYEGNPNIAEHYQKSYEGNMEKAYFSVSMEVLGQVGETGSGTKKALDREELTKSILGISEIACEYLQNILTAVAYQRLYIANGDNIEMYVPYVRSPRNFDNYTKVELTEIIEKMDKGGFENSIIIKNQLRLAEREFGKQSPLYKRQILQSKIDPLAGVTTDIRQQVMASLTWEEVVLSLRFNFIIEECEKEEEVNQTTCQIDERKKKLTCKPKVNAFWLLSEAEQAERIKAKAEVLASATKENAGLVLGNSQQKGQQQFNNLETVQ